MKTSLALLVLIGIANAAIAKGPSLEDLYPSGEGARFQLQLGEGVEAEAMIYISESSENKVGVEMFLSTTQMGLPIEMWQQTILERSGEKIAPVAAYLQSNSMKKPEIFDLNSASKKDGLQMSDFLLVDKSALEKFRVGEEEIATPAGTVKAVHFRQTKNKETIDYWISDVAKPLGLVRVDVKGQLGFSMKLGALIKNVKRKIDPARAVPVTAEGRSLLSLPTTLTLH